MQIVVHTRSAADQHRQPAHARACTLRLLAGKAAADSGAVAPDLQRSVPARLRREASAASACSVRTNIYWRCSQQLWRELGGTFRAECATAWCQSRARLAGDLGVAAARRRHPRHQQVQQQRDGAAVVPDAVASRGQPVRRRQRTLLAQCASGSMRNQLEFPELQIDNGSGLVANERISPRHLGELLAYAWRSPLMPEYVGLAAHTGRGWHFATSPGAIRPRPGMLTSRPVIWRACARSPAIFPTVAVAPWWWSA